MQIEYKLKPVLCLDMDGTIRRSKSGATFIKDADDIVLIPGVEEKIWKYSDDGYIVTLISNQGGVAHAYKSEHEAAEEVLATMRLFKRNPFHVVQVCYFMEDGKVEPWCHRSLTRKPGYGMLVLVEAECFKRYIIVDWDKSLFVGDRPEDAACAANAGINFMHIDLFLNS
jgi:HAD superfamily hydrolase (TIGR01662 family)